MNTPEEDARANGASLKDELYSSAVRFTRSALRAFLDKDFPIFLLHAGTALEHLTKAYLASLHESLIAATDFDSLLQVSGLGARSRRRPSRMKTISLPVALERAGNHFIPALDNLSNELSLLVDVRNGVAHMGRVDESDVETVLVPFLQACEELCAEMGFARADFWGDFAEMVRARLSASAEAAEIRAGEALTAARLEFESRYSGMPHERDVVLRAVEETYQVERYQEDLVPCPACSRLALASGGYLVSWEADWDQDDFGEPWLVGTYPVVKIVPSSLRCRVCGLRLSGSDELRAAGLPQSWEIKDVDPEDFESEKEEAESYYDE